VNAEQKVNPGQDIGNSKGEKRTLNFVVIRKNSLCRSGSQWAMKAQLNMKRMMGSAKTRCYMMPG